LGGGWTGAAAGLVACFDAVPAGLNIAGMLAGGACFPDAAPTSNRASSSTGVACFGCPLLLRLYESIQARR
jgi:hypothetical protein